MQTRRTTAGAYVVRNAPSDVVRSPLPGRPGSSMPPPADSPYAQQLPPPPPTPKLDHLGAEASPRRGPRKVRATERPLTERPLSERPPGESVAIERIGPIELDAISELPPAPEPVARVATLVAELCACAPGDEHLVISRLRQEPSEAVLRMLTRHFPGPLWFDRKRPHRRLPSATLVSAVSSAFVALGGDAAPYVAHLLRRGDDDQKFYAALIAGECPNAMLLRPLWRLALGGDPGSRRAALSALATHRGLDGFAHVLDAFRSVVSDSDSRQAWRLRAIDASAALHDAHALGSLVEALADKDRAIARASHDALVALTCHDLGPLRRPWRRWSKTHGHRHRVEWLLDALADRRRELRLRSWKELTKLSGDAAGLSEASPRGEFQNARATYARWWQAQ